MRADCICLDDPSRTDGGVGCDDGMATGSAARPAVSLRNSDGTTKCVARNQETITDGVAMENDGKQRGWWGVE
jgi:hypothetical protein